MARFEPVDVLEVSSYRIEIRGNSRTISYLREGAEGATHPGWQDFNRSMNLRTIVIKLGGVKDFAAFRARVEGTFALGCTVSTSQSIGG